MKRFLKLLVVIVSSVFIFNVNAKAIENQVELNFDNAIIHDGYVEYAKIGKVQLFKDDVLVVNIANGMKIDLEEAEYEFVVEEIEDKSITGINTPIKLNINNWYYPMSMVVGEDKSTFKLDSSKFSSRLDIKLVRVRTVVNTKVENVYDNITSKGVIDLSNNQEYIIDFSKNDELTEGLKTFVDLQKTLYYKNVNGCLVSTDNESEAVIKIVGNASLNRAVLTAINIETKKSDVFKGINTKYTGSKLQYNGSDDGILNETRTDYYTKCNYEFTILYVKDVVESKEYKFIEGENQTYTKNKSENATFRIDADYSLFINGGKVFVDNILVDANNYSSKAGSTIIILKGNYLNTLDSKEHTLRVSFNDGKEVSTKFVTAEEKEIVSIDETIENPKTNDSIVKNVVGCVISVLGLVVAKRKFY